MRVKVRLFAQLRDVTQAADVDCTVDAPATVRDVWQTLVRQHPALAAFSSSLSSAVNLAYVRMDAAVHEGDEVAFLPPVSGG